MSNHRLYETKMPLSCQCHPCRKSIRTSRMFMFGLKNLPGTQIILCEDHAKKLINTAPREWIEEAYNAEPVVIDETPKLPERDPDLDNMEAQLARLEQMQNEQKGLADAAAIEAALIAQIESAEAIAKAEADEAAYKAIAEQERQAEEAEKAQLALQEPNPGDPTNENDFDGDRDFDCVQCAKSFKTERGLATHIQRVHSGK